VRSLAEGGYPKLSRLRSSKATPPESSPVLRLEGLIIRGRHTKLGGPHILAREIEGHSFMSRLELDRESVSNFSQGLNDGGFWQVGFGYKDSTGKHVELWQSFLGSAVRCQFSCTL
jgi:hypothetical protein